jgi:hypothetical protein
MAITANGHAFHEYEPGIEVVPQPGIEVVPAQEKEAHFDAPTVPALMTMAHRSRRKKKIFIITAVCAGVIILVGVLAGVLIKHHSHRGSVDLRSALNVQLY